MDELLNNIGSFAWWLSVVGVGILLNLTSAYMKSPLDRLLSLLSDRWQTRTEIAKQAQVALIADLRSSTEVRTAHWHTEVRARLHALTMYVLGTFLLLFYTMIRVRVPSLQAIQSDAVVYCTMQVLYYGSMVAVIAGVSSQRVAARCRRNLLRAEGSEQTCTKL